MENFNGWWIIWGAINVLAGVLVGIIMAITMGRKGRISLCMFPLVVWQIFWMSWASARSDVLYEWINNNGYSFAWYQTSFIVQTFFFWICVFLALLPAIAKDKPAVRPDPVTTPTYE